MEEEEKEEEEDEKEEEEEVDSARSILDNFLDFCLETLTNSVFCLMSSQDMSGYFSFCLFMYMNLWYNLVVVIMSCGKAADSKDVPFLCSASNAHPTNGTAIGNTTGSPRVLVGLSMPGGGLIFFLFNVLGSMYNKLFLSPKPSSGSVA